MIRTLSFNHLTLLMDSRHYQQGLLELESTIHVRYLQQRNSVLDTLSDQYSECRTRLDRLEFIQLNLARFKGQLALNPHTDYQTRNQFCEAHLQLVSAKRKRFSTDWYLAEPHPITAYIEGEVVKAAINWLERRAELHRGTNKERVREDSSSQPVSITIVPLELIPQLSTTLGQYLTPASRLALQPLLSGNQVHQPLIVATQTNRFVHAFAQLIQAGIIQENKQQVRDWLITHFLQKKAGQQQALKANSVWDYLSKENKKPVNPIDILYLIGWKKA